MPNCQKLQKGPILRFQDIAHLKEHIIQAQKSYVSNIPYDLKPKSCSGELCNKPTTHQSQHLFHLSPIEGHVSTPMHMCLASQRAICSSKHPIIQDFLSFSLALPRSRTIYTTIYYISHTMHSSPEHDLGFKSQGILET